MRGRRFVSVDEEKAALADYTHTAAPSFQNYSECFRPISRLLASHLNIVSH